MNITNEVLFSFFHLFSKYSLSTYSVLSIIPGNLKKLITVTIILVYIHLVWWFSIRDDFAASTWEHLAMSMNILVVTTLGTERVATGI